MNGKKLSETNPHLRDPEKARRQRVRSVASSTAIETGELITEIEAKIKRLRARPRRIKLA